MKNILVPIGSSKGSVNTLQYAIDFAQEVDANVYVISIFKELSRVGGLSKVNTLLKEESENRIDEVLSKVDSKGVSVIAHPVKGEEVEAVTRFNKHVPVDLMMLSPRSNSSSEDVYLGNTTGKLVKGTDIPALIVPKDQKFEVPKTILVAFKNGRFAKKKMLEPLRKIQAHFECNVNLLHVETPESTEEMKHVSGKLEKLSSSYTQTQNATTYQGVLEHFQHYNPDMICVIRRKRGFFKKLWEKNIVSKKEFFTTRPLLILRVQDE